MSFFVEAREIGVARLAQALGIEISKDQRSSRPCPVCHAVVRSKKNKDNRMPVGFSRGGKGWECQHCHEKGDGVDFVSYHLHGERYRDLSSSSQRREIHQWYDEQGFVTNRWTETRKTKSTATINPHTMLNSFRQKYPPKKSGSEEKCFVYPPIEEVLNVWENSLLISTDREVYELIQKWGAQPSVLELRDLARVLPPSGVHFPWMTARGQKWQQGWRLIVPARNEYGEIQSLKARWIRKEPPPGNLKSASPKGFKIGGLVTLCDGAEFLLKTESCNEEEHQVYPIWITEGEKDFLAHAGRFDKATENSNGSTTHQRHVTIGIWAGSWTDSLVERIPLSPNIRFVIAVDSDAQGQKYEQKIKYSLLKRGFQPHQLERWKP